MRKPDAENLKLLVSSICLRRNSLILPSFLEPISIQHRPELSSLERRAYSNLAQSCRRAIDAVVSNKRTKRGNNTILTALLKLRIFCNNGLSTTDDTKEPEDFVHSLHSDEVISLLQQSGEATCATCGTDMDAFDQIGARELTKQTELSRLRLKCQDCTKEASAVETDPADRLLEPTPGGKTVYPSKLKALLADIQEHQSQDKRY